MKSEKTALQVIETTPAAIAPRMTEAETDAQLVESWLKTKANKSIETWRAYDRNQRLFLSFVAKPLCVVTVEDMQRFRDSLSLTYSHESQRQILASIKSLLRYGHGTGYLPFDVGKAVEIGQGKDTLGERLIDEQTVSEMIALEPNPRNKFLLRLTYASGGRVSEVIALKWRDLQANGDGGQVTLYGKGGKTRHVRISAKLWGDLSRLGLGAAADAPVFTSRKKETDRAGHLTATQAWRIVKAAARRVDPELAASPHWLRHAHATHALRRGASLPVIQATLGHSDFRTTQRYAKVNPQESSSDYLVIS
jgi:integrase/recombinase XerD